VICSPGTARISQRFRCFGAMAMVREPRIFAAMAKTTGCSFAAFNSEISERGSELHIRDTVSFAGQRQ